MVRVQPRDLTLRPVRSTAKAGRVALGQPEAGTESRLTGPAGAGALPLGWKIDSPICRSCCGSPSAATASAGFSAVPTVPVMVTLVFWRVRRVAIAPLL